MPYGLKRFQKAEALHFITFSCFHRLPFLESPAPKGTFEVALEQTRARHRARVYAYVLMPEHIHLLINEPPLMLVAQFLKGSSRSLHANCEAIAGSSGRTVILTRTSMAKRPGLK